MKALLVGEYRDVKFLDTIYESVAFAEKLGADTAVILVGNATHVPRYSGNVYLAEVAKCGEYNPNLHKQLILEVVQKENPDYIVFPHSSYGWDLAPRVAASLRSAQISEVVGITDGLFEVGCCNAKMRRTVKPSTAKAVITLQAGAFSFQGEPQGTPSVHPLDLDGTGNVNSGVRACGGKGCRSYQGRGDRECRSRDREER
jgi:electron transfer flavoprotein alpha subunit